MPNGRNSPKYDSRLTRYIARELLQRLQNPFSAFNDDQPRVNYLLVQLDPNSDLKKATVALFGIRAAISTT